jgi:hypothetical protein
VVLATPASAFTLHNFSTGLCLTVAAGKPDPGADMVMWTCDGSPSQQWGWGAPGQAWPGQSMAALLNYYFSGVAVNRVIGVRDGQGIWEDGVPLIDWFKKPDVNQLWQAFFVWNDVNGHECYYFRNGNNLKSAPKVMGVFAADKGKGAPVVIWDLILNAKGKPDRAGHPDQYWCVY